MRKVWNATTYALLYEQLVSRFGPLDAWESYTRPGRGLNQSYAAFLKSFAEVCDAKSAKAVELQVKHVAMFNDNIVEALNAGFVRAKPAAKQALEVTAPAPIAEAPARKRESNVRSSEEMILVAYFLARCGDHQGPGVPARPPLVLDAPSWNAAYDRFYQTLSGGRYKPVFRRTLKNHRDRFDAYLNTGRIGWRAADGKPAPLTAAGRRVLANWQSKSTDDLWTAVKAYLPATPSPRASRKPITRRVKIRWSPEMALVGYFLARFGDRTEGGPALPPTILETTEWNIAYDGFYEALSDGRDLRVFRNSLKNLRDLFDSHLDTGRAGWRAADGSRAPRRLTALASRVFAEWQPKSFDAIWTAIKPHYTGGPVVGAAMERFRQKMHERFTHAN